MAEYIGRRIVPTHSGVWNETKEYEELVIVLDEESGDSYISRIPVPSGTALDDEEYWMLFSIYSEQIQEALDAIEETSEELKDYVDSTATSLTEYVQETATELTEQVEAAEDLTESNTSSLTSRMETIEARLDANVTASTDSDADYAAEVVDARVNFAGTEYESLGTHIRTTQKQLAGSHVMYLSSFGGGAFSIDTSENTIQVTTKLLGVMENKQYMWVPVNEDPIDLSSTVSEMRILGYDAGTETINLYATSEFRTLGSNGYYIASLWKGILYNAHMSSDVAVTYNGTEYRAADLFDTDSLTADDLAPIFSLQNVLNGWGWTDGYINDSGSLVSGSSWATAVKIPVSTDVDTIIVNGTLAYESITTCYNINCYDEDGSYLGGCLRTESGTYDYDYYEVTLPDGTAYVSVTTSPSKKGDCELYCALDLQRLAEETVALAGTRTLYLASGAFTLDQDTSTYEGTIQVTSDLLGVAENSQYVWVYKNDEAYALNSPTSGYEDHMRIFGYDASSKTVNLFLTSEFRALGTAGYYIASWWKSRLYNPHMSPDVKITYNGTTYSAGELFHTDSGSYVAQPYKDYVEDYVSDYAAGDTEEDDLGDIVSPSHWDCMEGRQFSMFFDCLSRHEGRMNLYRLVNSMSLTRNEYCMNFTPDADDDDFTITIRRLNENTMETAETKTVTMKVHHPLTTSLTKNVCICGDSLVDNKYLAQEVWDMLDEDGDCVVNHIGTRGGTGYEHEGRGSWTWAKYLQGEDYSNKSNAFWDADNERLDFQKYCEDNGYEGIDYFLIALGTNDVSQGSTLYNCEDDVQKFIDYAKEFIDALLDEETGFPDCKIGIGLCGPGADYSYLANSSMQIFRRSINTLNLALIKNFDDGAYHENVTCFAHGLRTDRMHAFPYSDSATTDRFEETSRTLTNSIHPSSRGYQAWADGYYCQIRAWLEEDAEEVAQG